MCRYAHHVYKYHYACFKCRKMFRRPQEFEMSRPLQKDEVRISPCPQCSTPMKNMGRDFKAPRQTDLKQWQKVQELFEAGFGFGSCGCNGPGVRPRTLKEVKPFIEEQKRKKAEDARQVSIKKRATERDEERNHRIRARRPVGIKWSFYQVTKEGTGHP
jgi:hypothetical protein